MQPRASGRAGELLKMHNELSGRVLLFLGWDDRVEGERLVLLLSYRALRSVLAIPPTATMLRVEALRRMSGSNPLEEPSTVFC